MLLASTLAAALLSCVVYLSAAGDAPHVMNRGGVPYAIANPNGDAYKADFNFEDDGKTEFFDVYGEVRTRYSQVYWTRNNPINLPKEIIERFDGKVMAIVGYEVDQVTHQGPQNGSTTKGPNSLGGFACYPSCDSDDDKSVPIFNQYNHHYFGWLTGKESVLQETSEMNSHVPNPTRTRFATRGNNRTYPSSIVFKENPGGEFRKSYHAYPKGFAQLLESPTQWVVEPMQIDTHNRDFALTDFAAGYNPSFLPKIFTENTSVTDLKHDLSPLIECPCTDRIDRIVEYSAKIGSATCQKSDIGDAESCSRAVEAATGVSDISSSSISDESLPLGCLIARSASSYRAIFNSGVAASKTSCSELPRSESLRISEPVELLSNGQLKLNDFTVDRVRKQVNLTLTGSADAWFAIGFDAESMADLPYAVVVEVGQDNEAVLSQRKLANHGPGTILKSNGLTLVSDVVDGAVRTVIVTRPLNTSDYDFPQHSETMNVIAAIGNSPKLAYHKARSGAQITLLPSNTSCVCRPDKRSFLSYMNESKFEFDGYGCAPEPRSDMLVRGDGTGRDGIPNAACSMETYHGGLQCCKHEFFLTDRDQGADASDDVDVYFLKWRYYFQEYMPATSKSHASHQHLHHWVFLIDDAVNDYEEDNAHYGRGSVGKIEAHLQAKDMGLEDIAGHAADNGDGIPVVPFDESKTAIVPIVMTPHCHAPSCIRQELWNADTNTLLCNATARYGSAAYGSLEDKFNEPNYITISPCLFGDEPGLQKPFRLMPHTNLTAIKYFNNTYRHLGQMAQWTGLMVYETDPY